MLNAQVELRAYLLLPLPSTNMPYTSPLISSIFHHIHVCGLLLLVFKTSHIYLYGSKSTYLIHSYICDMFHHLNTSCMHGCNLRCLMQIKPSTFPFTSIFYFGCGVHSTLPFHLLLFNSSACLSQIFICACGILEFKSSCTCNISL